jgi:sensor histidine kinase YesM
VNEAGQTLDRVQTSISELPRLGWIAYCVAWLAAALFWTMASASGAGRPPSDALAYGLLAMGSAGVMGVGVWRLTGPVPWESRSSRFYVIHGIAATAYSTVYAVSWLWLDVAAGRMAAALTAFRTSPILIWNLMMGSWLYLIVAGISYAIRAQSRARAQEAAAAQAHVLAQQAQLAALRAQINPHFLFNALHSVGALVSSDPVLADRALEQLGDLLRYVLDAADAVPFSHEWRFTKDYLALEELRFGSRLEIDEEFDNDAGPILVPPLIFQPLVENAVRHGIADRPEGGRIAIRARVEGEHLVLKVTDNGRGNWGNNADGIGMGSIRRRLDAMYGDHASIYVSQVADGYSVTLALPLAANGIEAVE